MGKNSRASNARLYYSTIALVVLVDVITKGLAANLLPLRVPHPVMGWEWLRLTLVYNRGAAFGINLGHDTVTRVVFTTLTVIAIVILWNLYRQTRDGDWKRTLAVSLVSAGAMGNLIDRVSSSRGVVDFLDIGIGASRWPTFNVADMAVTTGAVILATVLWREERDAAAVAPAAIPITSVAEGGETGG